MSAYTVEQLAQMASAWRQARTARYAAFRASLSAAQLDLWAHCWCAERELIRVRTWQDRSKRPRPRPHNLIEPTWPEEAAEPVEIIPPAAPNKRQTKRRLTSDETAMIVDLYQAGYSGPEIGKLLGISRVTIQKVLERKNVKRRPLDLAAVSRRYHGGTQEKCVTQDGRPAEYKNPTWLREQYEGRRRTLQEIADECGVHFVVIQYWIKKFEIPTRDRRGRDKEPT